MKPKHLLFFVAFFALTTSSFAQEKVIKVACIGNSITYGSGLKDRNRDSYPMVLGRMLGEGYEVQNFGLGGRTMLRKGDRPYIFEKRFKAALAFNPDIVVIKLGTNDTKYENRIYLDEYISDATALVDSFKMLPSKPKIFLCSPATVYDGGFSGINDSIIVNNIMPQIKKIAKKKKLQVVDIHKATGGMRQNFPDKVHPNEQGAIAIAEELYKAIVKKNKK